MKLNDKRKAVVAGAVAAVVTALTAYFTGTDEMGWEGLIGTVGAALLGYVGTYYTKNAPTVQGAREGRKPVTWMPRMRGGDRGAVDVVRVLLIVVLVLAIVVLGLYLFDVDFTGGGRG